MDYGFAGWKTIWNDPQNAELKKKRQNPNVLSPGDKLVIPEKKETQESGATGQHHKFKAKHKKLMLRLVLNDPNSNSLANKKCVLHIKRQQFEIISQAAS